MSWGQCYTAKWNSLKPLHWAWRQSSQFKVWHIGPFPFLVFPSWCSVTQTESQDPAEASSPLGHCWPSSAEAEMEPWGRGRGAGGSLARAVRTPGYPQGPGSSKHEEEALLSILQPILPGNMDCKVVTILLLDMFGVLEFPVIIWSVIRRGN